MLDIICDVINYCVCLLVKCIFPSTIRRLSFTTGLRWIKVVCSPVCRGRHSRWRPRDRNRKQLRRFSARRGRLRRVARRVRSRRASVECSDVAVRPVASGIWRCGSICPGSWDLRWSELGRWMRKLRAARSPPHRRDIRSRCWSLKTFSRNFLFELYKLIFFPVRRTVIPLSCLCGSCRGSRGSTLPGNQPGNRR